MGGARWYRFLSKVASIFPSTQAPPTLAPIPTPFRPPSQPLPPTQSPGQATPIARTTVTQPSVGRWRALVPKMAAHLHHRGSLGLCLLLCAALLQTRLVASSAGIASNPQVTLDDAAAAAVLRASDPACKGGLPYDDVCCPRACGECGGHGCGSRPGGAVDCCASGVQNQHRSCDNSTAPCTMDKPSPSGGNCTLQPGVLYVGNDVAQALNTSSVAACCAACGANQACAFFSYDMAGTGCYVRTVHGIAARRERA